MREWKLLEGGDAEERKSGIWDGSTRGRKGRRERRGCGGCERERLIRSEYKLTHTESHTFAFGYL